MPNDAKRYPCRWQGCRQDSTCVARLYVPPHALSVKADAQPVTAMLGITLCDVHFKLFDVKFLLQGERGTMIREAVTAEFRKRGAVPNFDKAAIGRIGDTDMDFGRFEVMNERARAN